MPRVAEFAGIVITMYFRDHNPPHFHARYAAQEALVRISDLLVMEGSLPRKQLRLVQEWAQANQALLANKWTELNP
jgi:hypothetical protein